jgi:hypothetical protein
MMRYTVNMMRNTKGNANGFIKIPPEARFVLDGEPLELSNEWLEEQLCDFERSNLATLEPGESMYLGGGAAPLRVLGREA